MTRDTRLAGRARQDDLLEEALAPPTARDAEEAVRYWRERLVDLPTHRRRDRREAREMLARWQKRLREARRREGTERPVERLVGPLADHLPSPRALLVLATTVALVVALMVIALLIALVAFWPEIEPLVDDLARLSESGADK